MYHYSAGRKKNAFFGIDCNAKSQAWNSVRSYHIGVLT
jgi:hypothetical protein